MRPPKPHALFSPWGVLQGSAKSIAEQYNNIVKGLGCAHAAVTVSQVRRLLRKGGLRRKVNKNVLLRPMPPRL